ncbi:extensin-like domain-containing protein [Hydrogenophaga laconesensis]|uniref:Extensin-like C-terminal domain-containing protein n=1 Tax=Hydrogenophaga laconesensis TaxID=1805971 RepID=A0ABU1VDS3_9BURK|nr:extensin family protein [Hydrogenophaga laconesensis]MDR7095323.1 hypothetical protein [Hydrogenophaga laconesensis]
MRTLLALTIAIAALCTWLLHSGRLAVPPEWNPWAPLSVHHPPNLLTRHKLLRLEQDAPQCQAVLDRAGLKHTTLPDNDLRDGCGWRDAVRVDDARFHPAFTLTCPAAVSLALWERHGLQAAASTHLGGRVIQVEHVGSYACRNVRGDTGGEGSRRSQHATANAFDVIGFRLADGRRVSVLDHWPREGTREARFLRDARNGACPFFSATLSPDYNAAHRDHLHLDRGSFRMCR